jgi:hypothetical protein
MPAYGVRRHGSAQRLALAAFDKLDFRILKTTS